MTLTSLSYFILIAAALVLYYAVKPLQKYVLLAASVYFYVSVSSADPRRTALLMLGVTAVTYLGALAIERTEKFLRGFVLFLCVGALVGTLFVLKYAYNLINLFASVFAGGTLVSAFQFASVIGISYYSLSAIGYLVDVYWQSYKAERNPFTVALFIFWFPQLISGPFTRFSEMRGQFCEKHCLSYDGFTAGARRMLFGYFKKLVISERFGLVVSEVFGNYRSYGPVGIIGATLCYAVQLYTDFSGCMDIITGTSQLFGIELPENFRAPFFSETVQEFWQRWHITLGTWFRDYLMYPVQKSGFVQKAGKGAKKLLGKKAGKKVPFYMSMLLLWILIGIWHGGTSYYFIASAAIPCVLLMLSDILQPLFKKTNSLLHIEGSPIWLRILRRIRTLLLICICWTVVCAGSTQDALAAFAQILHGPVSTEAFRSLPAFLAAAERFGLLLPDLAIMLGGLIVLYVTDRIAYKGSSVFEKLSGSCLALRLACVYGEVLLIYFFGMLGSSEFIYFQF